MWAIYFGPLATGTFRLHAHGHATRLLHLAGVAGLGSAGAPVHLGPSLGAFPCQKVRENDTLLLLPYRRRGSTYTASLSLPQLKADTHHRKQSFYGTLLVHSVFGVQYILMCFCRFK